MGLNEETMAKKLRVTSFAGKGALVQALALLMPFLFGWLWGTFGIVVGLVLALVLFLKGSSMSLSWRCGACGNPVHDKHVKLCPVCKEVVE